MQLIKAGMAQLPLLDACRCRLGCPDSWTTSWQLQLLQMQRLTEQQLLDYSKYRKAWGLATMDFIQLMRIDYDASFRCDCCKGEPVSNLLIACPSFIILARR